MNVTKKQGRKPELFRLTYRAILIIFDLEPVPSLDLSKIMDFYNAFVNKNALDFTVFPSSLLLENDLVAMCASLLNGVSY